MKIWSVLLVFVLGFSSAQEALQAIPLLEGEPGAPSLFSSEIVGESEAQGRAGDLQTKRDYRSKLLVSGDTGNLADVAWTFYQNAARVVPTVSTSTTGNARTEAFGYVNGFLAGFLANVCFDIAEDDLEALGTWYVATLGELAEAGQGEADRQFGPVHISLELSSRAKGGYGMKQTLWRDGEPGRNWSSFCTLEPVSRDSE